MIVLGSEGMGECVRNPCSEDQLWTGEQCVEMYGQEGCNGRGEMRLYNVTGGIECKCEDGWGRLGGEGVSYQHSVMTVWRGSVLSCPHPASSTSTFYVTNTSIAPIKLTSLQPFVSP